MIKIIFLIALFTSNALYAQDVYDANTNQLTIQSVNVGNTNYKNVVISVGNVISVGSSAPINPSNPVAGAWNGVLDNGKLVNLIVMPNNYFYAIIGNNTANGFIGNELDIGSSINNLGTSTTIIGGMFSEYTGTTGIVASGVMNGSFIGNNISASITYSSQLKLSSTLTNIQNYTFYTPADINMISGFWTGSFSFGNQTTINISQSGVVSGNSGNCAFSGSISPNNSSVNIFDVNLTFQQLCPIVGSDQSGIAYVYPSSVSGKKQLIVTVRNSNASWAVFFTGIR